MNPDFVTLMAVSATARSYAQSALPDAPMVEDFVDRSPRQPRLASLRKQLATFIWPGELIVHSIERVRPAATGC